MTTRGYPHRQPFCVTPRRNLTKRKAWWQIGHASGRKPVKDEA